MLQKNQLEFLVCLDQFLACAQVIEIRMMMKKVIHRIGRVMMSTMKRMMMMPSLFVSFFVRVWLVWGICSGMMCLHPHGSSRFGMEAFAFTTTKDASSSARDVKAAAVKAVIKIKG